MLGQGHRLIANSPRGESTTRSSGPAGEIRCGMVCTGRLYGRRETGWVTRRVGACAFMLWVVTRPVAGEDLIVGTINTLERGLYEITVTLKERSLNIFQFPPGDFLDRQFAPLKVGDAVAMMCDVRRSPPEGAAPSRYYICWEIAPASVTTADGGGQQPFVGPPVDGAVGENDARSAVGTNDRRAAEPGAPPSGGAVRLPPP